MDSGMLREYGKVKEAGVLQSLGGDAGVTTLSF